MLKRTPIIQARVPDVRRREVPESTLALWLADVARCCLSWVCALIHRECVQPLRRLTLNDRVNVAPEVFVCA